MQFEPIIKLKLKNFKEAYDLDHMSESVAFEWYTNKTILTSHQPDAFSSNPHLLEKLSVGGLDDIGIDGIAIKYNGILVSSKEEIDDLKTNYSSDNIEFIFIQSKYKRAFDSHEYAVFLSGVKEFLSEKQNMPVNEGINEWLSIKEYIFSDDIILYWEKNPVIRLYYVVMGEWNDSPHITAKSEQFTNDLKSMNMFDDVAYNYIDSKRFKSICDENDNNFTEILNIIDSMSLTEVNDVENSCVVLCSAAEYVKLLTTSEGIIRKTLFTDNVRDYQGDTSVNNEIMQTAKDDPKSFILLNNGITIVCNSINPVNRKITIKNPQVVNGCQTSSVIYHAYKEGICLDEIILTVKFIATKSSDITNRIVRGTNKQNVVLNEVFEITRDFHKNLEEYIHAQSIEYESSFDKIFYERRSKQFADNLTIKENQKISFKLLTQSFVSLFFRAPYYGHRHESFLLTTFQNRIYIKGQSFLPYYLSALLSIEYSKVIRELDENDEIKNLRTYKYHILMASMILMNGVNPDFNKEKMIDSYCKEVLDKIKDRQFIKNSITEANQLFYETSVRWTQKKGANYKYGIKSSTEFNDFFMKNIVDHISKDEEKSSIHEELKEKEEPIYRGIVLKLNFDKNGYQYGFISRMPDNVFFHSNNNQHLDYNELLFKDVTYKIIKDDKTSKDVAIDVKVVKK